MSPLSRAQPFGSGFQSHPGFLRKESRWIQIRLPTLARVRALNEIAKGRGQTLAQMALAWVMRNLLMTSTLVGASSVKQLKDNVAAVQRHLRNAVELGRIIGSVDRAVDFDRLFRPRRLPLRRRLRELHNVFPEGVVRAISTYEVDGMF